MLENGTPPAHHATISSLDAPWLQLGTAIKMQMDVTNTDPSGGAAIGFTPQITFLFKPYGKRTFDGPLIFAGHSRTIDYSEAGDYFGPVLIHVAVGDHTQTKLVFAITGYWRWLAPLIVLIFAAGVVFFLTFLRNRKNKHVKQG
jgi:hypothetical protein